MKLKLTVFNNKDDIIRWELWNRGLVITRIYNYVCLASAVDAAKRVAKSLNIDIVSASYLDIHTGYSQNLKF